MQNLAIRATRLFDGAGDSCVADPLVILAGGRIERVEVGAGAVAPPGSELVELPGATLLPGLVDTHVHLAFDAGPAPIDSLTGRADDAVLEAMAAAAADQLAAGVTTVRDLGDRDYLALRLRAERTSGVPTVLASGPPITSVAGHCHFLGGEAAGVDGVRDAVRERAERGVDVIKVMASGGGMTAGTDMHASQFDPAELRAIVEEAHRFGLPVTAHAYGTAAIAAVVEAGTDGIEHCTFLTADGVGVPDELLARLVEQQIAIGATVGSVIVPGSPPPPPTVARFLPQIMEVWALLCRSGARVVAGTDAGIASVKPHGVLPHGLADLAALGLGNAGALRAGTTVAAQVCGVGATKGRVAAGFDADLLAVDGDPVTDIGALLRPVAVFARGSRVR